MKFGSSLLLALLFAAEHATAFTPLSSSRSTTGSALFMSDAVKKSGTVKWFNTLKGYGFIVPDDGGADIFVHQTEIQTSGFRSLADGEAVEFVPQTEDSGKIKATQVTGPGGAQVQGAPFRPREEY
mmetsp:Transcript_61279/g.176377  ORF Transcript_61279/g.176377 Transcript_61279/m.176377 type:complete len:126 (-) Transcript_61279:177-554(-)|eukprot:CAMPEP_0176003838 /NCGR_PEP_ID=MMETSP0120_2-20121206/1380_1 /TAXON_ID=160619 /ORGANISM="Kryptoperidinium foliaceum, Strain CCMP 1326" /LENGTH=125 /DNA_ID=CAMNT_0017336493 /DNA_START=61 /DNA_END=438 /DNA_ORIENTATION=-